MKRNTAGIYSTTTLPLLHLPGSFTERQAQLTMSTFCYFSPPCEFLSAWMVEVSVVLRVQRGESDTQRWQGPHKELSGHRFPVCIMQASTQSLAEARGGGNARLSHRALSCRASGEKCYVMRSAFPLHTYRDAH